MRDTPLTEEPPDPTWLNHEISRRREIFDKERRALSAARQHGREQLTLPERLARVLAQSSMLQTPTAGAISRGVNGSESDRVGPPSAHTIDFRAHLRLIELRVREMERDLDAHLGLDVSRDTRQLTQHEKDRELLEDLEGLRPEDVSDVAPWQGSARTVRRIRAQHGRRGVNGEPIEGRECEAGRDGGACLVCRSISRGIRAA